MAEFCLDCFNKINKSNDGEEKFVLSKDLDLCEGCGQWKHVVIMERRAYYMHKFRYFILPFKVLYFLWRVLLIPYVIFKRSKLKKN